jgi:hypothetical protein
MTSAFCPSRMSARGKGSRLAPSFVVVVATTGALLACDALSAQSTVVSGSPAPRQPEPEPEPCPASPWGPCGVEGQSCSYTDPCGQHGMTCSDGRWLGAGTCNPPPPMGSCPPEPPPAGASCLGLVACEYDSPCGPYTMACTSYVGPWMGEPPDCSMAGGAAGAGGGAGEGGTSGEAGAAGQGGVLVEGGAPAAGGSNTGGA